MIISKFVYIYVDIALNYWLLLGLFCIKIYDSVLGTKHETNLENCILNYVIFFQLQTD